MLKTNMHPKVTIGAYRVTLQLLELINKYSFPDENLSGFSKLFDSRAYGLISGHFFQLRGQLNSTKFSENRKTCLKYNIDYNTINMDSILQKAAFEGKLHPYD